MSDASMIGHNAPPEPVEIIRPVIDTMSAWLGDHPVIQDHPSASQGAAMVDALSKHIKDLEDERTGKVKPLNEEVKSINGRYKAATGPLEKLKVEFKSRLTAWARAEEDRRRAEAEAARMAAEAAAQAAREAAQREAEAIENASCGDLDANIGAAIIDAEIAAKDAGRAERDAARSERDAHVRMKAGNARAMSLRTVQVFDVTDPVAAMIDLPLTDDIRAAIIKAARSYHKQYGKAPAGVSIREERSVA